MNKKLCLLAAIAALTLAAPTAFADDRQTNDGGTTRGATDHSSTTTDTGGATTSDTTNSDTTSSDANSLMLKDLLDDGFEIKSVLLVPSDVVKAGGADSPVDAVMIVVERGTEIANCYVVFSSFADGSYYSGVKSCTLLK